MNFKAGVLSMSLPLLFFLTAKILNEKTLKKQQVVNLQCYERRRPPSPLAELSPPPLPPDKKSKHKAKIGAVKTHVTTA